MFFQRIFENDFEGQGETVSHNLVNSAKAIQGALTLVQRRYARAPEGQCDSIRSLSTPHFYTLNLLH